MANVISDETMEYVGILAKLELPQAMLRKFPCNPFLISSYFSFMLFTKRTCQWQPPSDVSPFHFSH